MTSSLDQPVGRPFSAVLRERTAEVHARTENAPFLRALSHGRVTAAGVAGLLQRLVPVYAALEDLAVRWAVHPGVAPLLVPGLERGERLRADLVRLGADAATCSPAATAYAQRVRDRGEDAPGYVAHHYTRYLGDLSGGQVVRSALRTRLGLELDFFDFPDLRGPVVKRGYRAALDALVWSPADQEAAVAEAGVAFACNEAIAAELEQEVLR